MIIRYTGGSSLCLFSRDTIDKSIDIYYFFVPIMICVTIGFFCMSSVMVEIYLVTRRAAVKINAEPSGSNFHSKAESSMAKNDIENGNHETKYIVNDDTRSEMSGASNKMKFLFLSKYFDRIAKYLPKVSRDQFKRLRMPFIFFIVFFIFWIIIFTYRFNSVINYDTYKNSFVEFAKCSFTNYDGTDSWKQVCGQHPKERPSIPFVNIFNCFIFGQGLIMSLIYLSNPSVWKIFFHNIFDGLTYVATLGKYRGDDVITRGSMALGYGATKNPCGMKNNSLITGKPHVGKQSLIVNRPISVGPKKSVKKSNASQIHSEKHNEDVEGGKVSDKNQGHQALNGPGTIEEEPPQLPVNDTVAQTVEAVIAQDSQPLVEAVPIPNDSPLENERINGSIKVHPMEQAK